MWWYRFGTIFLSSITTRDVAIKLKEKLTKNLKWFGIVLNHLKRFDAVSISSSHWKDRAYMDTAVPIGGLTHRIFKNNLETQTVRMDSDIWIGD